MKKIPKRNYSVLVVLLIVTVILTLSLANIYKHRDKMVSNFYNYANKITKKEFDELLLEHSDLMIYMSDKYDISNEQIENKLEKKIDELSLKNNLIYIDKSELNKEFLNQLNNKYNINIDKSKLPILIFMSDRQVVKTIYVESDFNIDTIDFGVFE